MAVLVREHAHTGVLGLHDVVRDLDVGARDRVAADDGRGVGPDGVDALGAAATGLVLARVHEHEVVDDAVRLEDVAVTVGVALVLDVVVLPGEVRLRGGQRVDGMLAERAGAARVVRMAVHGLRWHRPPTRPRRSGSSG